MANKTQDFRMSRVKFEDALKRIISAPPLPEKALKKEAKNLTKKLRRN
ncbi:MAG: hypothetical protein ACREFE_06905 [Limisphaerales bacterium]